MRKFSVDRFAGKAHYHGCTECKARFSCSCKNPGRVGQCNICRTGWPSLQAVRPKQCCTSTNLRRVRNDERESYKLAGDHDWLICTVCFRQQPSM